MSPSNRQGLDTIAVHGGEPVPRVDGAVVLPIFQSATFEHDPREIREGAGHDDVRYLRLNNSPNHHALHAKLALMEDAPRALVTSSGMAAITTAMLGVLRTGDHVLCQKNLYGGTHQFVTEDLGRFGIAHDFVDLHEPESWDRKRRPNTRVLYLETISNPMMDVPPFDLAVDFARRHDLVSMIDNTFASPINFRPLAVGFDISLHSATKYLNGHSDMVGGAIIGSPSHLDEIGRLLNQLGGTLDPHACFLLQRGLKTLGLRVSRQNENAMALARSLSNHAAVEAVFYPGLESHPTHQNARRFLDGFGGMLGFELKGGREAALQLLDHLELVVVAPSLGGVESLITLPSQTSHAGLSEDERRSLGITDGLVRVSVGIETGEDLVRDFNQALDKL